MYRDRHQSSERISSDADQLTAALQRPVDPDLICPQRFLAPLAPDEAARQEGRRVDPDLLFEGAKRWATECEHLLVEGAGGLFSPIADELLNLDLFLKLRTDPEFETELVLVAPNRLGVIHETLATVRAAIAQSAAIDRIYLTATQPQSDQSGQTNAAQLRHWLPEQKIVTVDWNGTVE